MVVCLCLKLLARSVFVHSSSREVFDQVPLYKQVRPEKVVKMELQNFEKNIEV